MIVLLYVLTVCISEAVHFFEAITAGCLRLSPLRSVFTLDIESTPRGGVNRCMANLMTNNAEFKY